MEGKVIISHKGGWACSNSAKMNFEDKVVRDESGKPIMTKRRKVLSIKEIYNVTGVMKEGDDVDVVIKHDETENMAHLSGKAISANRIQIIKEIGTDRDIITKILNQIKK